MAKQNPYMRLKSIGQDFFSKFVFRKEKQMWLYPKNKLNNGWNLNSLWERTAAAEQLGFNVEIKATEEGLLVLYVEKIPNRLPWEFQ